MAWSNKHIDLHGVMRVEIVGEENLDRLNTKLDMILNKLGIIQQTGEEVATDLTALAAEVQENTDAVASASALLTQLSAELRAAATDPAAIQALADQLDANNAALSQAVVENTPAAGEAIEG